MLRDRDVLDQLRDERSRRVVLVSHCLLNAGEGLFVRAVRRRCPDLLLLEHDLAAELAAAA